MMPLPETCPPATCERASGAVRAIEVPPNLRTEAMTAISESEPLPMVMVWPLRNPIAPATEIAVAPASIALLRVAAPAVPTFAMTAGSRFAPVSIIIFWPALKPATLSTLMFVAPASEAADRVAAACV